MRNLKNLLDRGLAALLLALLLGTGAAQAQVTAYVTNQLSSTLSVIDVATNTVVGSIPLPGRPFTLVITADGSRAYVTLGSAAAVAVVDLATSSVVTTVPVGLNPNHLTLSVDEAFLYVVNRSFGTVSVIDTATNAVVATVPVGSGPVDIAAAPDGASVWVPRVFDNVSVMDTATQAVTSFSVGSSSLKGLVFTPDGAFAYLGNSFGGGMTLVIDTATRTVVASIPTGSSPYEYTITPDGARVYLTRDRADSVAVIDTATNTLAATVPVGDAPVGVAITPDGAFAYVVNFSSDSVSVIDTATNTVVATVPVEVGPTGIAIRTPPPVCVLPTSGGFSGEVARWLADGDALDSIGSNHGTLLNGASFGPGLFDQAFVFDGFDDYVSVPDSAPLSVTSTFTLAAWVKPVNATSAGGETVMAKPRNAAGTGVAMGVFNGSTYLLMNNGSSNCGLFPSAPVPMPAGQWSHIATSFNAGTMKTYVNGVLAGTGLCSFASILDSAEPFVLGREFATPLGVRYYPGAVDKAQVFDHALTDVEVKGLFDSDCDGVGDNTDSCQLISNPTQADSDNDGLGDACARTSRRWRCAGM